jgi:acetyltransferase-like isoleucine patch superfamily enzyme
MISLLRIIYMFSPSIFRKRIFRKIIHLEGGQMYSSFIREVFMKKHNIQVGYGSYGGCFDKQNVNDSVVFGNYCSIAKNFKIFRANHPKDTFTTHPLLYNPIAGYVKKDKLDRPKLFVGNDVWIGENVIILPSVKTIGNGAILGAGAIVTKDVEPYSIVVGNPSKPIGKRFNDSTIIRLEETRWWELDKDTLIKKMDYLKQLINESEEGE